MFERFTERARQVVVLAQDEARAMKHNYIGTEHLLLGLLREGEGLAARVLGDLGVAVEDARERVGRIVPEGDEAFAGQVPLTPRAKKVLELSLREALSLGHNYIGTEHILLGLVREGEGIAARILDDYGAPTETVRRAIIDLLSGRRSSGNGHWTRAQVNPGQLWLAADGSVYRVVGIADEPSVVLEGIATGRRESYVISSPVFAEFALLEERRAS